MTKSARAKARHGHFTWGRLVVWVWKDKDGRWAELLLGPHFLARYGPAPTESEAERGLAEHLGVIAEPGEHDNFHER
jgi:hypothetical protein